MKYCLILCGLFFFISCEKHDGIDFARNYVGEASAKKNGKRWKGRILASKGNSLFGFNIYNVSSEGFDRGTLFFSFLPLETGTLTIRDFNIDNTGEYPMAHYITSLDDGHVIGNGYQLVESDPNNYFEITKYKEDKNKIKGEFALTFEYDDSRGPKVDDSEAETLVFTKGSFSIEFE